jgi:hypothetical protein
MKWWKEVIFGPPDPDPWDTPAVDQQRRETIVGMTICGATIIIILFFWAAGWID